MAAGAAAGQRPDAEEGNFGRMLAAALAEVEAAQVQSSQAGSRLAAGDVADLSSVVIASEKATISLQLALAVRNKVLEAYQEVMRMPI